MQAVGTAEERIRLRTEYGERGLVKTQNPWPPPQSHEGGRCSPPRAPQNARGLFFIEIEPEMHWTQGHWSEDEVMGLKIAEQ